MTTNPDDMLGRTLLGRYRIVMPIGHGGMGTVYLARTEGAAGFAKPVVIKQILPALVADGGMVQLFIREARILSNLHHPGIVNVLDFGEENGAYVMVLEYVHGYNLAEWAKYALSVRERIEVDHLIYIMSRVLDTLHYAHTYRRSDGKSLAIIHRDVSPGNVLLDTEGHVKLADFGIARATDDAGEYRSRVGSFKGKLAYSAPELVAGEEATPRSDVYASAVVLLHLLLGRNPFKGQTMADSVQRVLNLSPPVASEEREDVPAELDEAIARALMKSPKKRFPDAASFAEALRHIRRRPEEEVSASLAEQLRGDFESDMPRLLGLEPLTDRDGAWRGSIEKTEASLRSTLPPPKPKGALVTEQATMSEGTLRESTIGTTAAVAVPPRRARWVAAGLGATALAAVGVTAAVLFVRQPAGSAPQYVVIERKSVGEKATLPQTAAAATPAPSAATTADPEEISGPVAASAQAQPQTPGEPAQPPTAQKTDAPASGQTDTAALSRTVQQRGGAIQGCFQQHVESLGGTPQVSIRFSIDPSGNVTNASVSPASLMGTPLGGCLVGVAKSIKFPAQGKPMTFSIPITARVSR